MADRTFSIEVLLKARDDTAAAFAAAMGSMSAYDKKLDEQKLKNDALVASHGQLERSYKRLADAQKGTVASHTDNTTGIKRVIEAQAQYQRAAEQAARAQARYREGDLVGAQRQVAAIQQLRAAENNLRKEITDTTKAGAKRTAALKEAEDFRAETRRMALYKEQSRILSELEQKTAQLTSATDARQIDRLSTSIGDLREQMSRLGNDSKEVDAAFDKAFDIARLEQHRMAQERSTASLERYHRLVDQVAQAEQRRDATVRKLNERSDIPAGERQAVEERLNVNVDLARAHLEEFRLAERAKGIDIPVHVRDADIDKAKRVLDTTTQLDSKGGGGGSGGGGVLGFLDNLGNAFEALDTSTSGFNVHFKNAFGFAAVALIQPLIALVVGLVGAMGALASAAAAAAGALGGLFVSMGAQGIPALGLLTAAMARLTSIISYVSTAHQQLQQRFIAGFQAAHMNALGINQVAIAQHAYQQALIGVQQAQFGVAQSEHSYSNALFEQQQAVRNVGIATLQLNETRQAATRQLQDLILQEEAAKLAAEASSLSVAEAQKALRAAIATGGDVQQAQLGLQQAQLQHVQSTVGAQRAIQDASRGSLARQGISQQVSQAQNAVTQARRAVVDANFSVQASANAVQSAQQAVANAQFGAQQARAAIALAREQAAGYNAGTAAQLAWLRSQMTATERSLTGNIQKIYALFSGVNSRLRPMTDAILRPFIGITSRILELTRDPKLMGAFQGLADAMGRAFGSIGHELLSGGMIQQFIRLLNAAAANMEPLARIAIDLFKSFGSIAQAAITPVHDFLNWLSQATGKFSAWAASAKGQNWLQHFFQLGFAALKEFLSVAGAAARLISAIVVEGGGAKTGISILQSFKQWMDRTATSIREHGSAWHTLQAVWATARSSLHALGIILGAVGHALMQLGASAQGRSALENLANIFAKVIVPALTTAFLWLGRVSGAVLKFISHHPGVAQFAKDVIAIGVAGSIASKGLGLIFGPLAGVVRAIGKVGGAIKIFQEAGLAGLAEKLGPIGPMLLSAFGNPVVLAVAAVVAAIVGLAAATGNLGKLGSIITKPFVILWEVVKPLFQRLGKALADLFNALGIHTKGAHEVVGHLLDALGFLFRAFVAFNPIVRLVIIGFNLLIGAIQFVTNIIKSFVRVFVDVFKLIGDIIHGRWSKIADDFKKIGKDIVKGFLDGFKIIGQTILNIFKDMINAVLKFLGISSPSKAFHSIGSSMVDGIVHAFEALPNLIIGIFGKVLSFIGGLFNKFFNAGWKLGQAIGGAFVDAGKAVLNAFKGIVNTIIIGPLNWLIDRINGLPHISTPFGDIGFPHIGRIGKLQQGGPVGSGYGGGDRHPALLEAGEHVWTKEEVRAAGGHEAVYRMRSMFGGGTQGGPLNYAVGGAVQGGGAPQGQRNIPGVPQGVVGSGQSRSVDFQGVHGTLGGDLQNVNNFAKRFYDDWKAMWDSVNKETVAAITYMETQFAKLRQNLDDVWGLIESHAQTNANNLYKNITQALTSLDNAIYNAFDYIQKATNASLKAFNATPITVQLGAPPKFAAGGVVGQLGERGGDDVVARVGRGEAILNYAHQRFVDPALRKMYGWGLPDLFDKVRGAHAGARGYLEGLSGYAAGGYVYPFGPGLTQGRTDMGLDMGGSGYIATIADATFERVTPQGGNTGWPGAGGSGSGAMIVYRINNGPAAGRLVYLAENVDPVAGIHVGQTVKAGTAYAHARGFYPFLEMGWARDTSGTTLAAYHASSYPSHTNTPEGIAFTQFIAGLAHGKLTGLGAAFGGLAPAVVWKKVQEIAVKGSGPLADLAKLAIKKVTAAANAFGEKKAAAQGGLSGSVFSGKLTGPVENQVYQFFKAAGFTKIAIAGMLGNALQESDLTPSAPGGGLWQMISTYGSGAPPLLTQMSDLLHQLRTNPSYGLAALNAAKSPAEAANIFMSDFERPATATENLARRISGANAAYAAGYSTGGMVPDTRGARAGARIPIIAHAGEWILNAMQQSKIAGRLGVTVERLKEMLGFTGGPIHFQGGGAPGVGGGGSGTPDPQYAVVNPRTGAYTAPTLTIGNVNWLSNALESYNYAQRVVINIERNSKKLSGGVDQFLKNFNIVGGDNGVFALAAQAISDFATTEQNTVALAASGVRVVNQQLRRWTSVIGGVRFVAPTAVQQATRDLAATNQIITHLRSLQREEANAYTAINREITRVRREHQTDATRKQLAQLLGAREQMLKTLRDTDGQLAQGLQDRYDKQAALFQSQTDQTLRGLATLTSSQIGSVLRTGGPNALLGSFHNLAGILSKVGPTIGQGIAQMAQGIAQTLGDPNLMRQADQGIVDAAQATQRTLQRRYQQAAARAQHDPRWQRVADDLLSQLETATSAVVSAQAQALTDAIQGQDVRGQMQQTVIDMRNRLTAVQAALGNQVGAALNQITISRANTANLQGQLGGYQALLGQAQAQGNVQAVIDLTTKIDDLTAQIAEANLQTQQLITAYRQLSVTMLQTQTQASSGFFGAANQIAQTLGAIAGNQNLPALIQYAKEAGQTLLAEGVQAVQNIRNTINDPNAPFGKFQGQASTFLGDLTAAFQEGPQVFANALANLAPQLSQFEALLPSDQQALFQNLVQALIDNTTAQTGNTQTLKELQGQTNQQQFTSSAWQLFREAIFNGLGGLLPQYAMYVPAMDVGGSITRGGLLYGHTGEQIIPANVSKGAYDSGRRYGDVNVNITEPMEVADPVHLGNKIVWQLDHNPNSR